ncbi:hypothetical protein GCM10018771_54880 [Streptomyces cellulosae]|nr:hypothetical protein GCM10018771_54880 [Streptomyces cellulosae]
MPACGESGTRAPPDGVPDGLVTDMGEMAGGFPQGGDGGARTADGGDGGGIRTFPFPVERSVCGVGMRIAPMRPDRTWRGRRTPGPGAPHRLPIVMLLDGGPLRHMIDFTEYEATAGDVLWIRPGRPTASPGTPSTAEPSSPCSPASCPAPPSRPPASTATTGPR